MKVLFLHFAKKTLLSASKPLTILIALISIVGFYLGTRIELKLSLTDLLPENHPAVTKFEKLTQVVGGVGYLIVVLNAEDRKSHLEVATQIIERLGRSELVRSAFFEREQKFFINRMLYYLDLADLQKLRETIKKQISSARRSAFDLGLWDDEKKSEKPTPIDPKLKDAAMTSARISPYLISKDNRNLLIMIKPNFDSTDLAKTRSLVEFTKTVLLEALPTQASYELTGRYYSKLVETKIVQEDIFILGSLSILLVGLILYLYLQSFSALLVVFVPVLMGLGITIGITRLCIGHINLITGFLIGIVSGLGVDYGIHLLLRLRLEHRSPSHPDPDPVWRTLLTSGHSVFIGAIAACFSFYLLCLSSFRAFSEFGFICGTGIASVFFCLISTFAALSRWFKLDKILYTPNKPSRLFSLPILQTSFSFVSAIVLTVMLLALGTQVEFEYDFSKMLQHSKRVAYLNALVDEIYERSTAPSALAAPTKQDAVAVEDLIKHDFMPHTVQQVVSGATIIPEKQASKQTEIRKIAELIGPIKDKWLEKAMSVPAASVRKWVAAEPFTFEDLPLHLKDALRGTGQKDFLLYLYPAVPLDNALGVYQFATMMRKIENRFQQLLSGSDAVLFADILDLINHDGYTLLGLMIFSVGFFIWLNVLSFGNMFWSYVPLLIALPVGMGLMSIFGVKFNIFNIAIIPTFVAMGIDVPIHILHRAKETGSGFRAARDLSASIHLALATAGIGFGILIFARTGVLKSLGWIALMGTAGIWWVGLVLLPACLERVLRHPENSKMEGMEGAKY